MEKMGQQKTVFYFLGKIIKNRLGSMWKHPWLEFTLWVHSINLAWDLFMLFICFTYFLICWGNIYKSHNIYVLGVQCDLAHSLTKCQYLVSCGIKYVKKPSSSNYIRKQEFMEYSPLMNSQSPNNSNLNLFQKPWCG